MKEGRDDRSVVPVLDLKWRVSTPGGGGRQLDGILPCQTQPVKSQRFQRTTWAHSPQGFPSMFSLRTPSKVDNQWVY